MAFFEDESHFRVFASNLEAAIKRYEALPEETLIVRQRRQLKLLISLESKLRKTLIKHPWGPSVYKSFMDLILNRKRNILAARPYFRERQAIFASQISKALKRKSDKGLYRFKFNYSFVLFIMACHKWPAGGKIAQLAKQIHDIRMEIMEMNLPLAISQARVFWSNTPRSHLSYMDLVQIHCGGLLVAIDKFVPPDTRQMTEQEELEAYRKFRAVAIGRMIGDRIEQYSETLIHYFPVDKRKIYRANKAKRHFREGIDFEKVSEIVNEGVEDPAHHTNPQEIAELLASASCVSGDVSLDPEGETTLDRYEADAETRPDLQVDEMNAIFMVREKYKDLPLIERKYLRMKGIQA
jgi:hypothetical protein